jgi:uncharacterized membrane protein YdbT with pleckstrin-like domain
MSDVAAETIRYRASPPMFRNRPIVFSLCVIAILVFGAGLVILLIWRIIARSEVLTITDKELRFEKGIFNKTRSEIALGSIRSVRVDQTLWQRLFGVGDVFIFSAGDRPEIVIQGMPEPAKIREVT